MSLLSRFLSTTPEATFLAVTFAVSGVIAKKNASGVVLGRKNTSVFLWQPPNGRRSRLRLRSMSNYANGQQSIHLTKLRHRAKLPQIRMPLE